MSGEPGFMAANWPAPAHIHAGTTLRAGGVSVSPYDSFNLGGHVGDDPVAVRNNRERLVAALGLPKEPAWLDQIHGAEVANLDQTHAVIADASVTTGRDKVAVVLTADCLPVVLCDRAGTCWGAAHGGWRGLAAGVLEAVVAALPAKPESLMAWLGPAIGPSSFEVGRDVLDAFCSTDEAAGACFREASRPGKYMLDIYALARQRLQSVRVGRVYGGGLCTVRDRARFYSYRRDGKTGRMATLIWSNCA